MGRERLERVVSVIRDLDSCPISECNSRNRRKNVAVSSFDLGQLHVFDRCEPRAVVESQEQVAEGQF